MLFFVYGHSIQQCYIRQLRIILNSLCFKFYQYVTEVLYWQILCRIISSLKSFGYPSKFSRVVHFYFVVMCIMLKIITYKKRRKKSQLLIWQRGERPWKGAKATFSWKWNVTKSWIIQDEVKYSRGVDWRYNTMFIKII